MFAPPETQSTHRTDDHSFEDPARAGVFYSAVLREERCGLFLVVTDHSQGTVQRIPVPDLTLERIPGYLRILTKMARRI